MNTILVGDGYWGNIVKNKLKKHSNLISVLNSKSNIDEIIKSNKIDFAFVCTNTSSHYEVVKTIINNNINVFCEKPFTGEYKRAKELFRLSGEKNVKIYVDNIFLDRDEIINIDKDMIDKSNDISFIWNKHDMNIKENLINSLLYHDLYILLSLVNDKLDVVSFQLNDYKLNLTLKTYNKTIKFLYDRNSTIKEKLIIIDGISINLSTPKNDPLEGIITKIVKNDYINYLNNEKITIDTLKCVNKIIKYGNSQNSRRVR